MALVLRNAKTPYHDTKFPISPVPGFKACNSAVLSFFPSRQFAELSAAHEEVNLLKTNVTSFANLCSETNLILRINFTFRIRWIRNLIPKWEIAGGSFEVLTKIMDSHLICQADNNFNSGACVVQKPTYSKRFSPSKLCCKASVNLAITEILFYWIWYGQYWLPKYMANMHFALFCCQIHVADNNIGNSIAVK